MLGDLGDRDHTRLIAPRNDNLSYSISTVTNMSDSIQIVKVQRGPIRRHDSRVQRFSQNYSLLLHLDGLAVDDRAAASLVEEICWHAGVESPKLKFHKRRSRYTGATEQPRFLWVSSFGEEDVRQREQTTGRRIPPFGAIRLGRQSTLMTIAHELGHHFVFALEAPATPAHGKIWIGRFDEAASAISTHLDPPR